MTQEMKNAAVSERIFEIISSSKLSKEMKRYDGFVPIDDDLLSDLSNGLGGGICFTDATPDSLDTPLHISAFNYRHDEKPDQIIIARKAEPKIIRRMTNRFSSDGYVLECVHFNDNFKRSIPVEVKKDQKFSDARIIVPNGYQVNEATQKESARTLAVLGGLQFVMENSISVYIKPDDSIIGFTFPIYSLSTVKDLFKMRNIEPGKKRRSALKHFVSEHYRRLQSDPNELVMIARYLRGATKFSWNGFECKINIPSFLLNERAE